MLCCYCDYICVAYMMLLVLPYVVYASIRRILIMAWHGTIEAGAYTVCMKFFSCTSSSTLLVHMCDVYMEYLYLLTKEFLKEKLQELCLVEVCLAWARTFTLALSLHALIFFFFSVSSYSSPSSRIFGSFDGFFMSIFIYLF